MLLNAGANPLFLTPTERTILETLWRISTIGPVAADDVLKEVHFTASARRAVILQRRGRFGYYYIDPETYDTPSSRDAALQTFVELLMFFTSLRQRGLVAFYEPTARDAAQMLYVGPVFEKPRAAIGRYILNSKGDYSEDPATIQDQDSNVILKGIRLQDDLFEIADGCTRGLVFASPAIARLFSGSVDSGFEPPAQGLPPLPLVPAEIASPSPQATAVAESAPVAATEVPNVHAQPDVPAPTQARARLSTLLEEQRRRREDPAGETDADADEQPSDAPPKRPIAPSSMPSIFAEPAPAMASELPPRQPRRGFSLSETSFITLVVLMGGLLALAAFVVGWWTGEHRRAGQLTPAAAQAAAPTAKAAPLRGRFHGLDVSRWNGDWLTHLRSPISSVTFVFVRASSGLSTDPLYQKNWEALKQLGMIRGTYHFFQFNQDPKAQAKHYAGVIGQHEPREIPPAVDFEELSLPAGATPSVSAVQDRLLLMLRTLESATGRAPIIYADTSMAEKWLANPEFARYDLWLADWSASHTPRVPSVWKKKGFRFWQRASTYTIPEDGRSPLDLDLFDGSLEEIYK